jgi:hypothetical protein
MLFSLLLLSSHLLQLRKTSPRLELAGWWSFALLFAVPKLNVDVNLLFLTRMKRWQNLASNKAGTRVRGDTRHQPLPWHEAEVRSVAGCRFCSG